MTTEFQAYSKGAASFIAATPRAAALGFFDRNPNKRRCSIIQGVTDGHFFTVTYGLSSNGERPFSIHDVTKKTACTLSD